MNLFRGLQDLMRMIWRVDCEMHPDHHDLAECHFCRITVVNKPAGIISGETMIGFRCRKCFGVVGELRPLGDLTDASGIDWIVEVVNHHQLGNGESVVVFHSEIET